jgi:hypothetical protein
MEKKNYYVYVYSLDDYAYVGYTFEGSERHKYGHKKKPGFDGEFFNTANFNVHISGLSEETAQTLEGVIYDKVATKGYDMVNKRKPGRKLMKKHAKKLKNCPICEEFNCQLTPKQVQELLTELVKCHKCGKEHKSHHTDDDNNYICSNCYKKSKPLIKCYICGKEHTQHNTDGKGNYICRSCKRKSKPLIKCYMCGKEYIQEITDGKGNYICRSCKIKSKPLIKCYICGKEHKQNLTDGNNHYICDNCYEKSKPLIKCYICGKKHRQKRTDGKGNYICPNCKRKLNKS